MFETTVLKMGAWAVAAVLAVGFAGSLVRESQKPIVAAAPPVAQTASAKSDKLSALMREQVFEKEAQEEMRKSNVVSLGRPAVMVRVKPRKKDKELGPLY